PRARGRVVAAPEGAARFREGRRGRARNRARSRTPARRPRRRRLGLPPRTRHHVVAPPSPRVPPIRWVRPPTWGESTREERRAGQAAPRHEQARLLERRSGKRSKSGPRGRKGGTMTRRSVVWVALLFSVSLPGVAGARSTTRLCHVSPGAQP